jgi:hypothetical protein
VVADLEAELGRSRRAALLQFARARPREVVELDSLQPVQPAGGRAGERDQQLGLPGRDRSVEGLRRVAGQRAHQESPGALVGDDRHGRPPAVGLVQPGEHLRSRLEPLEAGQQVADQLADARIRRHAPVLAPPVEPAPRQALDGLVEVLVEGEVEDELAALARVLVS